MTVRLGSKQRRIEHKPSWRFHHKKPIFAQTEDSLNQPFTHKLVHHGWRYLPVRDGLGDNGGGGHWVPPGFQPIEKEYVRPSTQEISMPGQMYPRNPRRQPQPPWGGGPLPGHGPGPRQPGLGGRMPMQGKVANRVAQSRQRRQGKGQGLGQINPAVRAKVLAAMGQGRPGY